MVEDVKNLLGCFGRYGGRELHGKKHWLQDKMLRSKKLFGCLDLTLDVCLILMSKFLVQEWEVKIQ